MTDYDATRTLGSLRQVIYRAMTANNSVEYIMYVGQALHLFRELDVYLSQPTATPPEQWAGCR